MAVISELIDVGLTLKEQGNHQGAIEHFRQLNQTYPNHARIMFELAGSWQAFGVPEQALPLYRQLMALPKSQGLPPKEMPRLYTQMGACLRLLGQFTESLEIIEEGLKLYPDYRPLRAYKMFALHSAGFHQNAMIDAFVLMLESLAPTKWDLYEEEIRHIIQSLRERIPDADTEHLEDWVFDEFWTEEQSSKGSEAEGDTIEDDDKLVETVLNEASTITQGEPPASDEENPPITDPEETIASGKIFVEDDNIDDDDSFEVEVKVIKQAKPKPSQSKDDDQFGKNPVKININFGGEPVENTPADTDESADEPPSAKTNKKSAKKKKEKTTPDDDDKSTSSGKINIPIDID